MVVRNQVCILLTPRIPAQSCPAQAYIYMIHLVCYIKLSKKKKLPESWEIWCRHWVISWQKWASSEHLGWRMWCRFRGSIDFSQRSWIGQRNTSEINWHICWYIIIYICWQYQGVGYCWVINPSIAHFFKLNMIRPSVNYFLFAWNYLLWWIFITQMSL